MADTQPRVFVTPAAWVSVATGVVTTGTVSPESNPIRIAISTGVAPTDLQQGHVLHPREAWNFSLEAGETLFAVATDRTTSLIATY